MTLQRDRDKRYNEAYLALQNAYDLINVLDRIDDDRDAIPIMDAISDYTDRVTVLLRDYIESPDNKGLSLEDIDMLHTKTGKPVEELLSYFQGAGA